MKWRKLVREAIIFALLGQLVTTAWFLVKGSFITTTPLILW